MALRACTWLKLVDCEGGGSRGAGAGFIEGISPNAHPRALDPYPAGSSA